MLLKPGFDMVVSVVSDVRKKFIGQNSFYLLQQLVSVVVVVSVVSDVRKKFIGQNSFYLLQQLVSVVSFVLNISTGGFHKVISVL